MVLTATALGQRRGWMPGASGRMRGAHSPTRVTFMAVAKLRAPIVLVHGLFGFDRISLGAWTLVSYFPGIPHMLRQAGNRVVSGPLSPTGGVAMRAVQLKTLLDRTLPGEPVHVIAHSMGGLDARYMVSRLGMAERVLTLTTVGTPHRGSPFADWGVRRLERVMRPLLNYLALPADAFYDLTTTRCREFNEQVPDAPGVRYFSVAGRCESGVFGPQWLFIQQIVHAAEGPNDGVVSVASATYGERTDVWDGDHMSLVNWPANPLRSWGDVNDRLGDYARLVNRLADDGF